MTYKKIVLQVFSLVVSVALKRLLVIRRTTEHGTAEGRNEKQRNGIFFLFFFFFFFFFLTKKQQQTNSKYISQNKGHAYILYPSRSI